MQKKDIGSRKTHNIDATDKILGRLASRVSLLLTGKNKANYFPNKDQGDSVIINNAAKIKVSGNKMTQKIYYRHSGYPGGLKTKKMKEIFEKNPAELLEKAIYNMLPKNKLRAERMKRLQINN
ncbi:50S ribosomal protein L13 [Patescibacteria group bacterium]|nr:50S ribosomal protein L13 [Patescibacteria group bacterium]